MSCEASFRAEMGLRQVIDSIASGIIALIVTSNGKAKEVLDQLKLNGTQR